MTYFQLSDLFRRHAEETREPKPPVALRFRSSVGFCTLVVWMSIFTDLLVYSIIVPVVPFRLEQLGYAEPSAMTGWLLVAYAVGLVGATPPMAYYAEKYWSRRVPLVLSVLTLAGSQVLYMEAPYYWLMCLARVIQGISSAGVWVVSFSLLCDTVPPNRLGSQLGIVMTGLTVGFLLGPPLGGILNEHIGYRAPFILGIIICAFDLAGRLLVIEKHVAEKWISDTSSEEEGERRNGEASNQSVTLDVEPPSRMATPWARSRLSFLRVCWKLCHSRRALTAFFNTFVSGITFTIMEPTLPLRLQEMYGFTSFKVGIIYLAAVVPSIISTTLSGKITDRAGVEWVTLVGLLASIPFWVMMAIRGPLALLIVSLALANFFFAATVTPVAADLASAARGMDGIGYAHVFGAFNFAYSCATIVGPLLGGQIYTHVENGWTVVVCLSAGLLLLSAIVTAIGQGQKPLLMRLVHLIRGESSSDAVPVALETVLDKKSREDLMDKDNAGSEQASQQDQKI